MNVNFYATFRTLVGQKTVYVDLPASSNLDQLVQTLLAQYPALASLMLDAEGKLQSHVHLFVNGRDFPFLPEALQTVLNEHDSIDIFPPVAGGSSETVLNGEEKELN